MSALLVATALIASGPAPSSLRLGRTQVTIGRGASVYIPVIGSLAKFARVESDDRGIVEARRSEGGFVVLGNRPGDAIVTVAAGKVVKAVAVSVRRWAVEFPQTLSTSVVGSPATQETVRGAVEGAIKLGLKRAPGTAFSYAVEAISTVGRGKTIRVPVRIKAKGPGSLSSEGRVTVEVENVGASERPESALWYSNDPENVRAPGGLFAADLEAGQRVRLLHHHINGSRSPMFFRVLAINDSDTPVSLGIAGGESGPDRDPVRAGLVAGSMFMRALPSASGEVVEVPPNSFVPLSFRRVAVGQTVSGLLSLVSLKGGANLQIVSDATPLFPVSNDWRPALVSPTPWRAIGARPLVQLTRIPSTASVHIYPDPFRDEKVAYRVGGRYGYLRIGQRSVVRQDREGQLDGNFGVAYRYDMELNNPTSGMTPIELVFEASAGYSAGAFLIDGAFVKTGLLKPKGQARLLKVFLKPGETRKMKVVTVPLSGSSYPATLIIRPIGIRS